MELPCWLIFKQLEQGFKWWYFLEEVIEKCPHLRSTFFIFSRVISNLKNICLICQYLSQRSSIQSQNYTTILRMECQTFVDTQFYGVLHNQYLLTFQSSNFGKRDQSRFLQHYYLMVYCLQHHFFLTMSLIQLILEENYFLHYFEIQGFFNLFTQKYLLSQTDLERLAHLNQT